MNNRTTNDSHWALPRQQVGAQTLCLVSTGKELSANVHDKRLALGRADTSLVLPSSFPLANPTMTFCGIIPVEDLIPYTLRDEYPLVKAACHYVIEDVYSVANLVQYYTANTSLDRDVEYVFPLSPDAAVCAFKAIIDDTTVIKGEVKEKEQAKRDYQEAVAAGKYAGLLEKAAEDGTHSASFVCTRTYSNVE